jgi:hypothetical protein
MIFTARFAGKVAVVPGRRKASARLSRFASRMKAVDLRWSIARR